MSEAILREDWLTQVELAFDKLKAADTAERQEWFEIIREDHGPDAEAELRAKLAAHDQAMEAKLKVLDSGQAAFKAVKVVKLTAHWRRDRKPPDAIKVARDILDVASKAIPEPKPEIEIADEEAIRRLKEAGRDVLDVATRPLKEREAPATAIKIAPAPSRLDPSLHNSIAPGLVGRIAEYVLNSASYPSQPFAVAVGLAVIGTLISRRIAGPSGPRGTGTHLYQVIIGPTGSGKEHVRTTG